MVLRPQKESLVVPVDSNIVDDLRTESSSEGIPVQVAEQQLHGVMVGFGQILDQFLHSLNFVFGFFDLCSEEWQRFNNCTVSQFFTMR